MSKNPHNKVPTKTPCDIYIAIYWIHSADSDPDYFGPYIAVQKKSLQALKLR